MSITWQDGDRIWAALVDAVERSGDDGDAFLARLVLVLANEVDDIDVVLAAIEGALEP